MEAEEVKTTWTRGFLIFLGKAVVSGQHSDIREFGKGALSGGERPASASKPRLLGGVKGHNQE